MDTKEYVIGVDYGTDSVRSVIIDAANGAEVTAAVYEYPRWKQGLYCNAQLNQFSQHPLDYIEGLEITIKQCISKTGTNIAANIKAISIDTTGSTPVAVDKTGTPLALLPGFVDNAAAMFILWKDHTAVKEADEINKHAISFDVDYLKYAGGIYSSEWFWSKQLHIIRHDPKVRDACYTWVEHSDWMPFLLTGGTNAADIKRNRCAAGHKGLWAEEFGGYPPDDFFSTLDPLLKEYATRLPIETFTADMPAGLISPEWANRLGLPADVKIGIGAIDAHMGAVGGEIKPYYLSKVMGTSTCDMMVIPAGDMQGKFVAGICGQVNGSIIPEMVGLEAGQSAFGDVYAWFKKILLWPLNNLLVNTSLITPEIAAKLSDEMNSSILTELAAQAALLPLSESDETSLDWLNGRRTPDADQLLKGAIVGLSLGTTAPAIFRSLAEATCFGAKSIIERFEQQGIPVKGIIGIGGVAKKSPYIMQMMADVLAMPIHIHKFEHTCALGAAMFATVVAGIHPAINKAMEAMGQGFDKTYRPNIGHQLVYQKRYDKYKALGNFMIENK